MDYQATAAKNIQEIIQSRGLKQQKVAELSSLSGSQLCDLLHGRKVMRIEHVGQIAEALGVTPNDLFRPSA